MEEDRLPLGQPSKGRFCKACQRETSTIENGGEHVCRSCGFVHDAIIFHHEQGYRSRDKFVDYDGLDKANPDRFSGTSRMDLGRLGLVTADEKARERRSQQKRTLERFIRNLCRGMKVKEGVHSQAVKLFGLAHGNKANSTMGEYARYMAAASVVIAIKEGKHHQPVSEVLSEVSGYCGLDFNKLARALRDAVKIVNTKLQRTIRFNDFEPLMFVEPLLLYIKSLNDNPTESRTKAAAPFPPKVALFLKDVRPKLHEVRDLAVLISMFAESLDLTQARKANAMAVAIVYMAMEAVVGRSLNRYKELWAELASNRSSSVYTVQERYREVQCAVEDWAEWLPFEGKLLEMQDILTKGWRGRKSEPMPRKEFLIRVVPEVVRNRTTLEQMKKEEGVAVGGIPATSKYWPKSLGAFFAYQTWRHNRPTSDSGSTSSGSSQRSASPVSDSIRSLSPASSGGRLVASSVGDYEEGFYAEGIQDDWGSDADSDFSDEELQKAKEDNLLADPFEPTIPAPAPPPPIQRLSNATLHLTASVLSSVSSQQDTPMQIPVGGWDADPAPLWPAPFSSPNFPVGKDKDWTCKTDWDDPRYFELKPRERTLKLPGRIQRVVAARERAEDHQRTGTLSTKRKIYGRFRPSFENRPEAQLRTRAPEVIKEMERWVAEYQKKSKVTEMPAEKAPPRRSDWAWESYELRYLLRNGIKPMAVPLFLFPQSLALAKAALHSIDLDELPDEMMFAKGELNSYIATEEQVKFAEAVWKQEKYDKYLERLADVSARRMQTKGTGRGARGVKKAPRSRINAEKFAQLIKMGDDDDMDGQQAESGSSIVPEDNIVRDLNWRAITAIGAFASYEDDSTPEATSESHFLAQEEREGNHEMEVIEENNDAEVDPDFVWESGAFDDEDTYEEL